MASISVVIITKNEADIIGECIAAAKLVTDDIVIIDNGSTDNTVSIARAQNCSTYQVNWEGYGANKNEGIALAKYDWILSLDADEVIDTELIHSLQGIILDDLHTVYDIKYHSYFNKKRVKFGFWGRDHHIRLFNRNKVSWSESKVHETLILPQFVKAKKIDGHVRHYSVKDKGECTAKAIQYAKLSAEDYFRDGRKPTFASLYISPYFAFFMNYIFFGGILDGKEGLEIAKTIFKNKWLKYRFLKRKISAQKNLPPRHSLTGINRLSIRNG